MNRTQMTLAGLLLLQLVLILVLRSPLGASTSSTPQPLAPGLGELDLTRLEIEKPGASKVTLVKQGEDWVVQEAGGFPADEKKVDELIKDLGELRLRRPVASTSRYHEAFKVSEDDAEARVRAWDDPQAAPDVDLIVGSSPNYRSTNVRRAGEDAVYEVQGLAAYDVRPELSAWIDKQLVSVPLAEIERVTLENAKGAFTLVKRDGAWSVAAPESAAGQSVETQKVEDLLRSVTDLRLADAATSQDPAAQGLNPPAARLTIAWRPAAAAASPEPGATETTPDTAPPPAPQELTLLVGAPVPGRDSERFVTRAGFAHAGIVWGSTVQPLLEQELSQIVGS